MIDAPACNTSQIITTGMFSIITFQTRIIRGIARVLFLVPCITSLFIPQPQPQPQPRIKQHPLGFYAHIPYCRQRCRYCNFAVVPVGAKGLEDSPSFSRIHDSYQQDILQELDVLIQNEAHKKPLQLSSIYFGGGTPSLAPVSMIRAILHRIVKNNKSPFFLEDNAEITMEMDPGTFSKEQLQELKALGINRVSLGVQSFDDAILEGMGRVHRRHDVMQAIDTLREVFGSDGCNYSIDLISGVPGLTLPKWIHSLEQATALTPRPLHISIYDLQIEEGTVFSKWYGTDDQDPLVPNMRGARLTGMAPGTILPLPSPESVASMYKFSSGYLNAKGYEHYEVSSYAYRGTVNATRKSNRSQHNQIYWAPSSSWYALGVGATDYVDGRLTKRPKSMAGYHKWVQGRTRENGSVVEELISDEDLLTDILLKRLRTSDGLDLDWIQERFGEDKLALILKGASGSLELGLAEIVPRDRHTPHTLRLKDPNGFLFSNYIISSIFAELGYV